MATRPRELLEPLKRGDDPTRWILQFDAVAAWQELTDEGKAKNALLALMGTEAFNMVADAIVPDKPGEKSLKELKEILLEQFQPRRLPIAARYEFSKLRQGGDDVHTYVRKLRASAEDCEFAAELDSRLRDQFVFGITNQDALKKMLTEKLADLTLKKAIEIATAYEAVRASQKNWQPETGSICRVQAPKKPQTGEQSGPRSARPWQPKSDANKWRFPNKETCQCCGKRGHQKATCRWKNEACRFCKKIGHLEAVCRQKLGPKVHLIGAAMESNGNSEHYIFTASVKSDSRYKTNLAVNGTHVAMIFDTAADMSLICKKDFNRLERKPQLKQCNSRVKDYNGYDIKLLGCCEVAVKHKDFIGNLTAYIVDTDKQNIMGRDWIQAIFPHLHNQITGVCNMVRNYVAKLTLKEGAVPVFLKPRTIPYGLRDAVKDELDRLVGDGILESIHESDWATPIVVIRKDNGRVRICGDYKVTVNPNLQSMVSTTPTIEDIVNDMHGSRFFTTLDLTNAYHQLPLDSESANLTTISTPFGLFRYNSLPFGIKQCPAIFQNYLNKVTAWD